MGNCQDRPGLFEALDVVASSVRVGLISDIQYADQDDGSDYDGVQQRHFRHALQVTKAAVDSWNSSGVNVVVQLGGIIDGANARLGSTWSALQTALTVLNRSTAQQRFDLIGNHELYNMRRTDLGLSGLNCTDSDGLFYRSEHLGPRWEAVILDAYEVALMGRAEDDLTFKLAHAMLKKHNPQAVSPTGCRDWFKGLSPSKYRFTPANGGISKVQLAWLDQVLRAAKAERRSVLLFSHLPLYEPATKSKALLWNCEEVLSVIYKHKAVVAVLAGHDHDGGYAVDPVGIHHITLHSALTAPPGTDCHGTLECFDDGSVRFHSHGIACVKSGDRTEAHSQVVLAKGASGQFHQEDLLRATSKTSDVSSRSTASSSSYGDGTKSSVAATYRSAASKSAVLGLYHSEASRCGPHYESEASKKSLRSYRSEASKSTAASSTGGGS